MRNLDKQQDIDLKVLDTKITFMQKSLTKIENFMEHEAIRRKDFEQLQQSVGHKVNRNEVEDVKTEIALLKQMKLDKDDFKPFKEAITRLNWLVITAVVVAGLALIIKM